MTLTSVSFLGKTLTQTNNLKNLNADLADLQRQLVTQKKFDTYGDIGVDSKRVQRFRADSDRADVFMNSINTTQTKVSLMSDAMTEMTKIAKEVLDSIILQTRGGEVEIGAINTVAQEHLKFMNDLLNTDYNGDSLFAGTDVRTEPFANISAINTNMQAEIANWLNGTQSVAALTANVQGFSGTDLGYSASLSTAEDIRVRIDTSIEVNYSVHADKNGIPDILRGIALAANLSYPDPTVDLGTDADFHQILNEISNLITGGIEDLDNANFNLASQASLMDNIADRHRNDRELFDTLISDIEDADSTEVITKLQSLQTQLTASYQSTNLIQQLSLVNFI